MRACLLSALVLLTGCPSKPQPVVAVEVAPPERPAEQVLADVDPAKGFQYFATRGGNHPTLYLDRAAQQFVIVGRTRSLGGTTRNLNTLPAARVDDALAAYHAQLLLVGYEPVGAPPKAKLPANAMVAVPVEDIFGGNGPSTEFPAEQAKVLYNTAPTKAWKVLSGKDHPTHDMPALTAYGQGLTVIGPGMEQTFPWAQSREAFAAYKKLAAQPARK